MTVEIKVPVLGESITEATVSQWFKQVGDSVAIDEPILELETDKVTVEVPAPSAGVLTEILVGDGINVEVGALLGNIAEGDAPAVAAPAAAPAAAPKPEAKPAPAPVPGADSVSALRPLRMTNPACSYSARPFARSL